MRNEEIERLEVSGWPLPDEYLVELGRLASLWAILESFMGVCIGKLAGFNEVRDPKPFILVNHASIPQKIDMLSTLCEHLAPEFPNLSGYAAVISGIRAAQRARNRFLHNGLAQNPKSGKFELAEGSARGTLKSSVQSVTATDIRRASVQVHLAQLSLYKLVLGRQLTPVWERRGGSA